MEDVLLVSKSTMQEAVFWFIPLIILAVIAVGGTIKSIWSHGSNLGMVVLGMPESGKTTWYDYMLKTSRSGMHTVDSVTINEFKISFPDGKSVKIKKGLDIGGNEENIEIYYPTMIEDADILLFFFNIEEYLSSVAYERDVNSRLDYIYSKWKEIKEIKNPSEAVYLIMTHKNPSEAVYLIMTHIDRVSNPNESIEKVLNRMRRRSFKAITRQYTAINMLNKEQLENLKREIFGDEK